MRGRDFEPCPDCARERADLESVIACAKEIKRRLKLGGRVRPLQLAHA
jgi:hypothetical protein